MWTNNSSVVYALKSKEGEKWIEYEGIHRSKDKKQQNKKKGWNILTAVFM